VTPRPHVVAHVAVSLDGLTRGFEIDVARYYESIATWDEDVTLAGADTILAQEPGLAEAPSPGPKPDGPLLAVVDARRRVREWESLRRCGHWRDAIALRAAAAPEGDAVVDELVAGAGDRVDLAAALVALAESRSARVVRVDSGGTLVGALLQAGLVDELSLLVHPCIAGEDGTGRWFGPDAPPQQRFEPIATEVIGEGLTWLRYRALSR
jgi:2,5-diamino-6-(ribosylamino)-4(3H)-pyrimidinone 5'-phosphate reductase